MSRFLWMGADSQYVWKIWHGWECVLYPYNENCLGFRRLVDVVKAFSCKLQWKWRLWIGIWSSYVAQVGWKNSFTQKHLISVDELMRLHTQIQVNDGGCSLLFDNWSGDDALVDIFDLHNLDALRFISLRETMVVIGIMFFFRTFWIQL